MKILFLTLGLLSLSIVGYAQDTLSNPSSCNLGLALNDATCPDDRPLFAPNRFPIAVNNAPGTQLGSDVYLQQVRLLIRHDWVSDLDLVLVSPGGQRITLTSDNGGGEANYGDPSIPNCAGATVFDVAACRSIDQTGVEAPFTEGPYQPETSFLELNDSLTNPNGTWILEICDDFEADSGYLDFVELVFAPLNCLPVAEVVVQEVDTTTVILNWDENGSCSSATTFVEYGPPGFTPGTDNRPGGGNLVIASCPPFALTGLDPETGYDIYLRRGCGGTVYSGNSCGTTVLTGCQPPPGAVRESFDAENPCSGVCGVACALRGLWYNPENGVGIDWQVRSGPTPTQNTGPPADAGGTGQYVYLETTGSACPAGTEAELRSGCFLAEASATGQCNLAFSYHMFGTDIGQLRFQLRINGQGEWQTIWQRQGDQGNRWHKQYLTFSNYQSGDILQFRFLATRGNGSQGDIALDDLVVYGLRYQGKPQNTFFADADGDGFGDPNVRQSACTSTPPAGFVTNDLDCDDLRADVNPDQPEVPCDNIDNNCNGLEDDVILPPPLVTGDTICSGQTPLLRAQPVSGKSIFWYTQPDDPFEIPEFGVLFTPELPPNNTAFPQTYTFYAEETDFQCFSQPRAEATIVVNPTPQAVFGQDIQLCPDASLDLAGLDIRDSRRTGAALRFFSDPIRTDSSLLEETLVHPTTDTTFYFQFRTEAGCTANGIIPVTVNSGPLLSPQPDANFDLCVDSEQVLSVVDPADTAVYQYTWSTGATTERIRIRSGDTPGVVSNYGVTVTDAQGCEQDTSYRVETITSIASIIRSIDNVSDCAGADGSITLTPQGGLPPYTYSWASAEGDTGRVAGVLSPSYTIDRLSQGAYRITISDNSSAACALRLRTSYVNGPDTEVTDVAVRHVACAGASDGQISLSVIGTPSYLWSTGDTTPVLTNVPGGFYSVTVTEANCQTVVDSILVEEPLPLRGQATLAPPSCFGGADGRVRIAVFGGSPGYRIDWADGTSGLERTNLSAGSYDYTITDANGCTQADSVILQQPEPLTIVADSTRSITCFGLMDGYLQVSGQGGEAPYSYRWSTGSDRSVVSNLSQNFYTVTVTDFAGCTRSRTFVISEPDSLRLRVTAQRDPVCVGDRSGRIAVAAVGGRMPYTYHWADGVDTAVREDLPVGGFSVVAKDATGCTTDTLPIVLSAVSELNLQAQVNRPLCTGRQDGRIELELVGQGPYQFAWARGDSSAVLTEVGPGEYPVRITDGNGCISDTSFQVTAISEPIQPVFSLVQPGCAGATDGRISTTISGTPQLPLQYEWNDGPFTSDRERIGPGDYQVTITDALGCRAVSDTLTIGSPDPLVINLAGQGDILCRGDSSGFLELDVQGGVTPYQYTWTGTSDTTASVYALDAGQYRVFVTDANGCPAQATYTLSEPRPLEVEVDVEQGNICIGDSSNQLILRVEGGAQPYAFRWNNGASVQRLVDVPPGDYSVTITDGNDCREIIPAIKLRPPELALQLTDFAAQDVSCFGARDGALLARITGGAGPYRYLFSNAELVRTDADSVRLTGLAPDSDYMVTVIDANGCVVRSGEVAVREPQPVNVRRDSVWSNPCFGGSDGAVFVSASGGTPEYTFQWFNADGVFVAQTEDLQGVSAGGYQLVVTDQRGCTDTLNSARVPEANSAIRITDTTIIDTPCKDGNGGSVRLQLVGGVPPYQFQWSNGATTQNLSNASAGTYALTLTDELGCRQVFSGLTIAEPATRITIQDSLWNPQCFGAEDGRIQVDVAGGRPPYQLTWRSNGQILALDTLAIASLSQGLYDLQVLDQNQCRRNFGFQLFEPDSLAIIFEAQLPQPDSADGRLEAVIRGGTPEYQWSWSNGARTEVLQDLSTGVYTLTVTDRNGCQNTDTYTLVSTAISESEWVESVQLYPNPAVDQINLSIALRQATSLTYQLFDLNGQILQEERWSALRQKTATLSLGAYPAGLYQLLLRRDTGEVVYTGRIIKRSP